MTERLPPQNVEAERAVLGSLLIDPDAILEVASFLYAEDFYRETHRLIYQAMLDLHERHEPADFITVSNELERRSQLAEIGGAAYLTALINAVPTSIHVEYYARIVERTAILRRLITAAGQIAGLAYEESEDIDAVVDRAEMILFGVSTRRATRGAITMHQGMSDYYDRIDYLYRHQGELTGIPTGLTDLDRILGGLQRSDLIIIAGRPGMGKSALALNIALHAARRYQKQSAIYSMEMSTEQIMQRFVSIETGIDAQRLRQGDVKDDEWPLFVQATGLLADLPIFVDDTPNLTVMDLRSRVRRLHAEHGLDLVFVDYLQLMHAERAENRVQEVSDISRGLKSLARELNLPVVAVSQLSRAVESRHDKRPILADLRESGALEQDSDVVLFVYRDELYNPDTEAPNVAEIIVAKQRSGPTGIVSTYFKKAQMRFENLEMRRALL